MPPWAIDKSMMAASPSKMLVMLAAAVVTLLFQPSAPQEDLSTALKRFGAFLTPRFQWEAPCPTVPPVKIDEYGTGVGLACQTAKANGWQARILWIDATANIDRYNSSEKIHDLVGKISAAGFNTVVFDVKPISGQTVYPSKLAPKLEEWRGQKLPKDFDPLPAMIQECHGYGLRILASMNAFSEGHRLFKVGPGYSEPEKQTVLYRAKPVLRVGEASWPLSPTLGKPTDGAIEVSSSDVQGSEYEVAVGPDGRVDSGWDPRGPVDVLVRTGSTYLGGKRDAAKFLKEHAAPGVHVSYDTEADYTRIGDEPGGQVPLMMNPNDPEVRQHALDMVSELIGNYSVDGLIYDDRMRYAGMDGDFSDVTRAQFEAFVGHKLRWPDDVFKFTINDRLKQGIQPGPYYDAWLAWRAWKVREYVSQVGKLVREKRPEAVFGAYVGSWYGDYPALGHNYAAPDANPGFWFATPTFASGGTAPLLDFLICGCYYSVPTIYDAMGAGAGIGTTVEGAGTLCNRLVADQTWTYAGIDCGPFANDPQGLTDAIQAACASTQGVMVFDLSHDVDKLWDTFGKAFVQRRRPPDAAPGGLADLRRKHALYERMHVPEPPIGVSAGAAGAGQ